ncbi:MAG TPA: ammonium transporter [Planctomycetota bacterium]|nr:ammonium transporter [Planctomycetota bacterium]
MIATRGQRHAWRLLFFMLGITAGMFALRAWGQDKPAPTPTVQGVADDVKSRATEMDTVWTLVTAFLVFWMQAGFALVETGLTRAKNTVNICMKNLLDFCFASIVFWAIGFGVMFGKGNGWFGTSGMFLNASAADTFSSLAWTPVNLDCKFIFQLVFAGTASTIVSGAMAERTKFSCYMVYSVFITALVYPVSGHWIWGGGILSPGADNWFGDGKGMFDFAGSTVVHSVGGWMALCGAFVLGPRTGKYGPEGKVNAIPGHNYPLMILGVFILWLGWFGFNPGSTMMATGMGPAIAHIAVTTNAAAAAGTIAALVLSKIWFGKWDGSMAGNGCLAGLVAITAPCAFVSAGDAAIIGALGGLLVVASVVFIDRKLKIDDPVGAVSVHLANGIFGTLCVGLFSQGDAFGAAGPLKGLFYGGGFEQFKMQAIGVLLVGAWCVGCGLALFYALKFTMGLRVSKEEEMKGLDVDEHGMEGYPDFMTKHTGQ